MRALVRTRSGVLAAVVVALALIAGVVAATAHRPPSSHQDQAAGGAASPALQRSYAVPPPLPIECNASTWLCALGERVATDLHYPWTVLGYTVRISSPPDDWHAGVTRHDQRVIDLYVREDSELRTLSRTLSHEIGHAIHTVCDGRLQAWRQRRGLPQAVRDHVGAPHHYDSVAEDFADAFAQYLGYGASRSTVGLAVTREWLQRNADLFVPCS